MIIACRAEVRARDPVRPRLSASDSGRPACAEVGLEYVEAFPGLLLLDLGLGFQFYVDVRHTSV